MLLSTADAEYMHQTLDLARRGTGFVSPNLFVPAPPGPDVFWVALSAFLLFRLFDIWKPPPARRFESLPGGIGVVADDLMAGVYANLCVQLLWRVVLGGAG